MSGTIETSQMGDRKKTPLTSPPLYVIVLISIVVGSLSIPNFATQWPPFPYTGVSLSLVILATLIYFSKTNKYKKDTASYLLTLFFAFLIFYRSNVFLTFLNILAAIFSGSFLVLNHSTLIAKLRSLATLPLQALVKPFTTDFPKATTPNNIIDPSASSKLINNISKNSLGILMALITVAVIVPFLSYSNPFFALLVSQFTNLFELEHLFKNLISFDNSLRLFISGFLILFLPRVVKLTNHSRAKTRSHNRQSNDFLYIAKVAVSIVLLLFLVTQAQLYLASDVQLQQMGYSNSAQTREVFAHLAIVSLIVFTLIYNNPGQGRSKLVTITLIIQSLALITFAAKSDLDYISNFGLTYKRLYGIAILIWTTSAFLLYIKYILSRMNQRKFSQSFAFITAMILITINIANFDYLIYHADSPRTGEGRDNIYMAKNLGPDSRAYKQILVDLVRENQKNPDNHEAASAINYNLYFKMLYLKQEYEPPNIRTFNYSRYIQYLQIKDIDLESVYSSVVYPTPPPPPPPQPPVIESIEDSPTQPQQL